MINLAGFLQADCILDGNKPDELEAIIAFGFDHLLISFTIFFFIFSFSGTFSWIRSTSFTASLIVFLKYSF